MKKILVFLILISCITIFTNSPAYCEYTSYTDITFDGESAVGQTGILLLEYSGIFEDYWSFYDDDMNAVYFKIDDAFKNQIKNMAKNKLKKNIKFKIVNVTYFQNRSPIGVIIEVNDESVDETMKYPAKEESESMKKALDEAIKGLEKPDKE